MMIGRSDSVLPVTVEIRVVLSRKTRRVGAPVSLRRPAGRPNVDPNI